MNNKKSNQILEKHQLRKNEHLTKKMLILFLFITLIVVYAMIFGNSLDINNHRNIHVDRKILTKQNSYEETGDIHSNIEIKTLENIKRILIDTQINNWTASNQVNPKVSNLSDGNFVVLWQSNLENGIGYSIYGRIFYNNGAKKGNEFHISNYTTSNSIITNVAASSSGRFIVVWQSDGNIFCQIFMDDATKISGYFQINAINNSTINNPSVTALKNNNFVVTWDDGLTIYLQILTDNGAKIGSQFIVAAGNVGFSSITSLANGNFVVAYHCNTAVCAKIFYSNCNVVISQFPVDNINNYDHSTSISSVSTSNFMVVWENLRLNANGADKWGIYGQSFTSSGLKIGNEFRVDTYTTDDRLNPSITSLANDNYIVTWQSNGQDGSNLGVYGQILDSIGNKIGNEFKVNIYTSSYQLNPSVSSLINSNFVVVWMSNGQDGNGYGIFGNIYQSDGSTIGFDTCPLNCQSCYNKINCTICNPNFQLQQSGLCECLDGLYLDISGYFCNREFLY